MARAGPSARCSIESKTGGMKQNLTAFVPLRDQRRWPPEPAALACLARVPFVENIRARRLSSVGPGFTRTRPTRVQARGDDVGVAGSSA
jgi:hypothetical protein